MLVQYIDHALLPAGEEVGIVLGEVDIAWGVLG
jgi:hypothetical protein